MACVHHALPQPGICEVCARDAARTRRRRRGIVVALAGLVPVAGAVLYLQTRPAPPKPAPVEPDNVLRLQDEALAKHPCDAQMLSDRVERFATLNRIPEALATARMAIGCGVGGRMPWRVAYLSQQLHQWLPTVVSTTALIQDDPADSDFWWWRADAWIDGKLPRLALFDLQQSLANSSDAQAAGFAAVRMLDVARATSEMCEADRAWRYYVHVLGGEPTQNMRDEHAAIVRDKTCDDTVGSGELPGRVRVTIGGATGSFVVDPRAGLTQISRMFAAKAGLESDPHQLALTLVDGRATLGEPLTLAKVTAGPVSAAGVGAVVIDDLPSDGVLGLDFLWHFAFAPSAHGFALRRLDDKPL